MSLHARTTDMSNSDSDDDDMPTLGHHEIKTNSPCAGASAAATTETTGRVEGEQKESDNTASSQFHHPASKAVLVPHRMLNQVKVHPGAVEALVRDIKQASLLKEQGNVYFKQGRWRDAESCYTDAILSVPLSEEFHYPRAVYHGNRGACYMKLTLYDKCIEDCSTAVELSPRYVKVLMRRAKAYELKEQLESALEDVKRCLEIDPGYVTARKEAVRLEKAVTEKQEKMKEEVIGKLKDLGNTILGKFGLSLDNFKMKKDPNTGGYSMNFSQ